MTPDGVLLSYPSWLPRECGDLPLDVFTIGASTHHYITPSVDFFDGIAGSSGSGTEVLSALGSLHHPLPAHPEARLAHGFARSPRLEALFV